MKSLLIQFHCESNTGYAIGRLEAVFYRVAMILLDGDESRLHIAYTDLSAGPSASLPPTFKNYVRLDPEDRSEEHMQSVADYITAHGIDVIFGFDQPPRRKIYHYFRRAGVKKFIAYWGAPMSSINSRLTVLAKRFELMFYPNGPDKYIFESLGMAKTATMGRGVSKKKVHVAYLGVDTEKFFPSARDANYVYEEFGIPTARKIFFYSGHMEERKGPQIIMQAANTLHRIRSEKDWHIVLLGNKDGQEERLLQMLDSDRVREHVTFGGYRNDVELLHRGCYAGIIASTGWDSLTCSSLEMQASGLPLLLSNLLGLNEAIVDRQTGILFPPGGYQQLAKLMSGLLDDAQLRSSYGANARKRIIEEFTVDKQIATLVRLVAE